MWTDNPYEFPAFWMKYSRPQYAAKTDLRAVFLITLLAAAGVQYFLKKQMYEQALGSIKKDPRSNYQMRLKELMSKSGPPSPSKKSSGAQRGEANSTKSKSTPKAEELEKRKKEAEAQLELELAEQLPPPPALLDNVAVSVFKLPLTLTYTALWVASGGMREPGYRTRRALGMTAAEWDALDEADRAEYLELELWVSENMLKYEEELKEAKRLGAPPSRRQAAADLSHVGVVVVVAAAAAAARQCQQDGQGEKGGARSQAAASRPIRDATRRLESRVRHGAATSAESSLTRRVGTPWPVSGSHVARVGDDGSWGTRLGNADHDATVIAVGRRYVRATPD